jgi:PAS domain S-box-containing protein
LEEIFFPFLIPAAIGLLVGGLLFAGSVWQGRKVIQRQVVAPLNQISQEAHYLAEGHYAQDGRYMSQASDYLEVASLADSFERMKQAVIAREASLQTSEERLRFAMEATSDGLWDWDITTDEVHYSPSYLKIIGYEQGEFPNVNSAWENSLHPDDRERVLQCNWACIENRTQQFEVEYRLRAKNGTWKWILARGKAVSRDANGRALRMVGTHVDMTEKKQVELALHQSRQQYKSLVDDLNEVVFQTDTAGRWTFLNPAWQDMTGFDVSSSLGQVFLDCIHPDDRQRNLDLFQSLIHQEKADCRYEIRYLHRAGGFRWVDVWARVSLDDQGSAAGTTGTLTDITERKRSEEAIRQLADELEQRVIERTASLEAANRELEGFSYSVSHDLRAPLRGIDGWSQILLEDYSDRLDDQARRYLQRVRNEAQRMGNLIDELLVLSRASLIGLENRLLDLSALAQRVADRLQEAQPERPVEWVIQPGLECRGDATLLESALNNLFQNAVKFTGKCPAPRIEFGSAPGEGCAVFFVADNGVGFDMEYAQNLFGPFQRLHKASQFPGTGIGLTIVKRIIQRHGGKIWAESRAGQGATFYFTLEGSR